MRDGRGGFRRQVCGVFRRPPEGEQHRPGQHQAAAGDGHPAERVVDLVPECDPEDGRRYRRDEQQPDEPASALDGALAFRSAPARSHERAEQPEHLAAEVDQGGGKRSQVDHDLEEHPRTAERFIR